MQTNERFKLINKVKKMSGFDLGIQIGIGLIVAPFLLSLGFYLIMLTIGLIGGICSWIFNGFK
jgi:hypothetical protein|tara:strand:- start:5495 stop:5683 length:189 start_codon:yes stop_codon:yes gene_type:complete